MLVLSMVLPAAPFLSTPASSDPWYGDDGDMTRNVVWNFTSPGDYQMTNASVQGGLGSLEFINSMVGESSIADYTLGTGSNINLTSAPDSIVIDDASLAIQNLILQPGPEGEDDYMDEWFPNWSPTDGSDLSINPEFDGTYGGSRRCIIIMRFNLSGVPADATVVDASLQLYEKASRPTQVEYDIRAVNRSWTEEGVSWTSRDLIHHWDTSGGELSTESFKHGFIEDRLGWQSFDMTRLVDLWLRNITPNFGFAIVPVPTPGDSTKTFTDCEVTNKPDQRPKLSINYTLGARSASYQSPALGEGLNSTFTLASWSDGVYSKASEEFGSSDISEGWSWLSAPWLSGGSVAFDQPSGWMNVTGSQSSNLTTSFNYFYQNITGDFSFETRLRDRFVENSMGAGLLLWNDPSTWIALYKDGTQGSGNIRAEVCKGGQAQALGSLPWTAPEAYLHMERTSLGYSLNVSADGSAWTVLATYDPLYDFTKRVALGLCLFSGGSAQRPVAEFDYARIEPLGESVTAEVRARTGNSTVLSDPSWTSWTSALPSTGATIDRIGRYVQYSVYMSTGYDWLSPRFSGFECHLERFAETGTITTADVSPPALSTWQTLNATQFATGGRVEYSYSTDHGSSWVDLGTGTLFDISAAQPSIMIKVSLTTYDTLSSPSVDSVDLEYLITHSSFYVSAPATCVAGQPFDLYVEPKDSANNTAGWTGAVSIHARDSSGVFNASAEVDKMVGTVPVGGHLTIQETYNVAETIWIVVSGGGATGISNAITILPGAIDHLEMEPNVTRLPEDNSSVFTAAGYDSLGNRVNLPITWHADAALGFLNSTSGSSVMLTTATFVSGGYLNVTIGWMTLSRYIEVSPLQMPPEIDPVLPAQTKPEDFGSWTLDLSTYVSDREDSLSELKWYVVNNTIVSVSGENRTGVMTITFTTIQNIAGVEDIEVRVVDTSRMMARASLTVNITPVNDPPRIDPISPLVVRYADPYAFDLRYYVHDVEQDDEQLTVSVDATSAPYVSIEGFWLTFLYPQSLNGTQQTVLVTVSDGELEAETYIVVKISDDYTPRTRGTLPNLEMNEGEIVTDYFDLDDYFTDPDGDTLTYTYWSAHVSVLIHENHTVDFFAPSSWSGTEYIVFSATDPDGARAESAMQVKVNAVNQPPVVSGVPDLVVRYGEQYVFDLGPYVMDVDEDPGELTVMTNDVHVWSDGLVLTIMYPAGMMGMKIPVIITVSDGEYSDACVMNITVSNDRPPVVAISPPDFSFEEDVPRPYPESGHINDFFSDPDGDPLVFYAFVSTPNMTATARESEGTWTVTFDPEINWYGLTYLTIRAMDNRGALAEATVTITVISRPDEPVLALPDVFSVTEGSRVILDITKNIADPDSVLSDFRFVVGSEYSSYATIHNGVIVFEFPENYLEKGEKSRNVVISITVFDQDNKFSTDTMTVTINHAVGKASTTNPILWLALAATAAAAFIFFVFAVIRRKKPFVVRDMMLIHNDGFLITRQAKPVEGEIDEQVLSGMLTAVLNFVEDSMSKKHGSLTTFGFQEYQVLVQRGEHVFAAVVFEGDEPDGIDQKLGDFIKKFDRIYRKKLVDWTGDIETDFAGADVLIQAWVKEHSKKVKEKKGEMTWKSVSEKDSEGKMAK